MQKPNGSPRPKCEHRWEPAPGLMEVLRCVAGCGAFGYLRQGAYPFGSARGLDPAKVAKKVKLYCCSKSGCSERAFVRVPGRGAGGRYKWACAKHAPPETTSETDEPAA